MSLLKDGKADGLDLFLIFEFGMLSALLFLAAGGVIHLPIA